MSNLIVTNDRISRAGIQGLFAIIIVSFCNFANAQSGSGDDFALEEIIVTAQKREQSATRNSQTGQYS